MKNRNILIASLALLFGIPGSSQTIDSLDLSWESSVNYGSFGQRTVEVNDTLWHFGGRFFYGTPFGVERWEQSFVEYMAPENNFWVIDSSRTAYRYYGNAEVYGDKVYLLGGGGTAVFGVEIFEPATRSLTWGADMPAQHRNGGSALYDGRIYMIGGSDDVAYTDRVDIYDIANDSWSTGAPLPVAMQTEAVLVGDKIYTMGGYDGMTHDEVFEYDIANDSWSQIGTTPLPTSAHKLEAHNGYIYSVGDYADLDRIMRYNTMDSTWVVYESNFLGRRHNSTVIHNDKLYIVAGNSSRDGTWQYFNQVQSIDLSQLVAIAAPGSMQPDASTLHQNFPNPFNPTTSIRFFLERSGDVSVTIYNLKGQQVRSLLDEKRGFGEHEIMWNGKSDSGKDLASGPYMYVLQTPDKVHSKRMVLLR